MLKFNKPIDLYVGGSLGDSYIVCCKIYNLRKFFTRVNLLWGGSKHLYSKIKSIYSILPDIKVSYVEKLPNSIVRGSFQSPFSLFSQGIDYGTQIDKYIRENYGYAREYPNFQFEDVSSFELPDNYTVICPQSGLVEADRLIPECILKELVAETQNPVFLGARGFSDFECIDLIGETTLPQAMSIVSNAKRFYGFQGLFGYVALSRGVPSTIYWKRQGRDYHGFQARVHDGWRPYLKEVKHILGEEYVCV